MQIIAFTLIGLEVFRVDHIYPGYYVAGPYRINQDAVIKAPASDEDIERLHTLKERQKQETEELRRKHAIEDNEFVVSMRTNNGTEHDTVSVL